MADDDNAVANVSSPHARFLFLRCSVYWLSIVRHVAAKTTQRTAQRRAAPQSSWCEQTLRNPLAH